MLIWHLHQIELEELDEEDFAPPPATNSRREALQVHRLIIHTYFYFWATLLHPQHDDDMNSGKSWINWICDWRTAGEAAAWWQPWVFWRHILEQAPSQTWGELSDHCVWALALKSTSWNGTILIEGRYEAVEAEPVRVLLWHWPFQPGGASNMCKDFVIVLFILWDVRTQVVSRPWVSDAQWQQGVRGAKRGHNMQAGAPA